MTNAETIAALLPCPFCGSAAKIIADPFGLNFQIIGCSNTDNSSSSLLCPNPSITVYKDAEGEWNYKWWNRRTPTQGANQSQEIASSTRERRGQLVIDHAADMLRVLNLPKNAEKGDWREADLWELMRLLCTEVEEIRTALWDFLCGKGSAQRVADEAADVSNFAAMIADIARHRYSRDDSPCANRGR